MSIRTAGSPCDHRVAASPATARRSATRSWCSGPSGNRPRSSSNAGRRPLACPGASTGRTGDGPVAAVARTPPRRHSPVRHGPPSRRRRSPLRRSSDHCRGPINSGLRVPRGWVPRRCQLQPPVWRRSRAGSGNVPDPGGGAFHLLDERVQALGRPVGRPCTYRQALRKSTAALFQVARSEMVYPLQLRPLRPLVSLYWLLR
jgi:hypothetical protein